MDGGADPRGDVTLLLAEVRGGSRAARDRLFDVVYGELRGRAAAFMGRQQAGHTLQPTALVHEAYLRLVGEGACAWTDRAHFFAAAAAAMRSILVDHARARRALKRGGDAARVPLADDLVARDDAAEEVLAVHDALERLHAIDPERARLVELRYFGGLGFDEIARLLGLPERSLFRLWDRTRAWLLREMSR